MADLVSWRELFENLIEFSSQRPSLRLVFPCNFIVFFLPGKNVNDFFQKVANNWRVRDNAAVSYNSSTRKQIERQLVNWN